MSTYDGPILDAFTHFLPPEYMEQVIRRTTNRDLAKRLTSIPMLFDVDLRMDMMRRWPN